MVAIKRLATVDANFKAKMDALLAFEAAADEGIERTVAGILADVSSAPTPAEGRPDRIVMGWIKLSYKIPRTI